MLEPEKLLHSEGGGDHGTHLIFSSLKDHSHVLYIVQYLNIAISSITAASSIVSKLLMAGGWVHHHLFPVAEFLISTHSKDTKNISFFLFLILVIYAFSLLLVIIFAKGLSILLVFSKNQLLVLLIFSELLRVTGTVTNCSSLYFLSSLF